MITYKDKVINAGCNDEQTVFKQTQLIVLLKLSLSPYIPCSTEEKRVICIIMI